MSFIIGIEVFHPTTAKLRKKPYEVKWNVNGASREQLLAASALTQALSNKLKEAADTRFPRGDIDGLQEARDGGGHPDRAPQPGPGEDGQQGLDRQGRAGPGEGV